MEKTYLPEQRQSRLKRQLCRFAKTTLFENVLQLLRIDSLHQEGGLKFASWSHPALQEVVTGNLQRVFTRDTQPGSLSHGREEITELDCGRKNDNYIHACSPPCREPVVRLR